MNTVQNLHLFSALAICVALAGCAAPSTPPGAAATRDKLTLLQGDAELANRAPVAIKDAEVAVIAAEQPRKGNAAEQELGQHLVVMADRKVEIARAVAQARFYEDQRQSLSQQREGARLDSRTAEADELQRQLNALNAKQTERGMVMTIGDLLFATGGAELRSAGANDLGRLAQFLQQHPERDVLIEGHTDNVGSDAANFSLSQRRAESVKAYLLRQGVASSRLDASGKGENSPVAGNESASGRQLNRRVEVIISNTLSSLR
ncbi:OmpA family protein [Pseudomonas sp. J452]|uniref:OmpA family protein n=1 Tax=Pseudomonas sp. J452 TaxID=2898441 RepID=UPI0021ADB793|nr:OmpA family protein [Pseudomonas sp. J452]UUY08242.1 OmpA family protein [Pseudomonas sp. J452]